jgi:hypothetical protein
MSSLLFSIDTDTDEVIVSESPKGSNQINFIERLGKDDNEVLYSSVATLTTIARSPQFDPPIFKAMDKVCQLVYKKHKETE